MANILLVSRNVVATCLFVTAGLVAPSYGDKLAGDSKTATVEATSLVQHLKNRADSFRHSSLEVLSVQCAADQPILDKLQSLVRNQSAFADNATESRLEDILGAPSVRGLEAFRGTISLNGTEEFSKWVRDEKAFGIPSIQMRKAISDSVVTRVFQDETEAVLIDNNSLLLYPPDRPSYIARLMDIDISLGPWEMMVRSAPLPGQQITVTNQGGLALIEYRTVHAAADNIVRYSFDPAKSFAPIQVLGTKESNQQDKSVTTTLAYYFHSQDDLPLHPITASVIAHRMRDGEFAIQCFLVKSWLPRQAGLKLPTLRLPSSFRLEDFRFGSVPLIKSIQPGEMTGRTVEDLMSVSDYGTGNN
jgi:hypothetical protein